MENDSKLDSILSEQDSFLEKYTSQEKQLTELRNENANLQIKIQQNEFFQLNRTKSQGNLNESTLNNAGCDPDEPENSDSEKSDTEFQHMTHEDVEEKKSTGSIEIKKDTSNSNSYSSGSQILRYV